MNKEEKIKISVNEEDLQNLINCYKKDIEYIMQLEKENKLLNEKIDKAIELNKQLIKDTKDFYRPTSDIIYSGDTLIDIAEQNLEILKEVE